MDQPARVTRRILPSAAALADAVARALVDQLATAQSAGRTPAVCLTGGTIAAAVYDSLARVGVGAGVDWSRVDFWWGDERFVAPDSDERNDRLPVAVLVELGADPARLHPMPAHDAGGVEAAAERYAGHLVSAGPAEFEVVLLGIGPDGHVASLFPGHPALAEGERSALGIADSPKPPAERVTLTLPTLNRARRVWFVASGADKASAVAAAQSHGAVTEIPARGVRGRLETRWWLDAEASSQLTR